MDALFSAMSAINGVLLGEGMLYILLTIGVIFTIWTKLGQYKSVTHGIGLISGKWTGKEGDGAISHFQALSAALSATVGLGNIGGVALAIEFGGPGAVFWMVVIGLVGMSLKTVEVTLAMLYRDTSDPDNPHGGTMWVAKRGLPELSAKLAGFGALLGGLFTLPLILFAVTGGNMFQAWNVQDITFNYFGVTPWITGLILSVVVGLVIIGGIKRIGMVAGTFVPVMCVIYVAAGLFVIFVNRENVPSIIGMIFTEAFSPTEAGGAFLGGTMGTAFIWGMKRALFSSEAGLGSAPIAHSAVKTKEPITEGVVAGLEPFIDTVVVCTITALVILSSGLWNRDAAAQFDTAPTVVQTASGWSLQSDGIPAGNFAEDSQVFMVAQAGESRARIYGNVRDGEIEWRSIPGDSAPALVDAGLYSDLTGATMTAAAFDSAADGLGKWMVTLAVWLFAISTMITWSYYGEQGIIYLIGQRAVMPYRIAWCVLIFVTCLGFIRTANELDTISTVALGPMLLINLPLMLILGKKAMAQYHDYFRRLNAGEIARASES